MKIVTNTILFVFSVTAHLSAGTAFAETAPFMQCHQPMELRSQPAAPIADEEICRILPHLKSDACARVALEELKARDPSLVNGPTQIVIIEHPQANAFLLDPVRIGITRGLLESAESVDDLRFVLAHELGHYLLDQHQHNPSHSTPRSGEQLTNEMNADLYAAWLLSRHRPLRTKPSKTLEIFITHPDRQSAPATDLLALRSENLKQFNY